MAFASETLPCVGAMAVSEATLTRMLSYFSSCSIEPVGLVSAAVSATGAGSALPVEKTDTDGDPAISVIGGLPGSAEGLNSVTVPVTVTELPMTAAAGSG